MKTPDLKPCPFCGYDNPQMTEKRSGNNTRTGDMFQILCGRCKARGPIFTAKYSRKYEFGRYQYMPDAFVVEETKQQAIEAWNRRVSDETPSRKPEDCLYYTANSFWGGGCLGTKEIDPCKGADCKNWKPKEDKR